VDYYGFPIIRNALFGNIFSEQLLGSVCVNDIFYFKKDCNNNIHLAFLDEDKCIGDDIEIDLGDTVDVIDDNFLMSLPSSSPTVPFPSA
jgi:hypothetical protein